MTTWKGLRFKLKWNPKIRAIRLWWLRYEEARKLWWRRARWHFLSLSASTTMMIVAWIDFLQSKESHSSPAQTVIAVSVVLLALVALMLPHVVETFSEEVGVSFERIKDDIRWHERRLNQSEEDLVERLKDMVKVQTAPKKSRGVSQL